MATNWDDIANTADKLTQDQFQSQISSLTSLNDQKIEDVINDTGISKVDLTNVFKVVQDATKSNADKADAIKNISKGVDVLVAIANKLI
jgi:Glu-tRNA(Gln) amidotransferase subunit E-like FAD-binding protein